jgi:serine/threonine protein kinase/TolA-binding protein
MKVPAFQGVLSQVPANDQPTQLEPEGRARPSLLRGGLEAEAVPGYEIVDVLGRGGMGVVYQARQLALKRTVALKMILTGVHASPGQLVRFRAEAEAVARLQHPNIVQVYEIGEHKGLPYISLEFVDGGSLDKHLAGAPQAPRLAARLMERLARAMHYAHQKGIVHRDLKPANVLLQKPFSREGPGSTEDRTKPEGDKGRPSIPLSSTSSTAGGAAAAVTWTPKITDFGLAKQLEEESGQTRSGAILGTPSYMAPEQAQGAVHSIGPASDVYALGSMLYETLTGRPPFRAAKPLDTVQQVISQDPVPPSRLNPKVPRDLETICLKCLQKEPRKRYASAEALAEDLRRFQASEPIEARPTPMWERAWKWARRRPAVAALVAVIGLAAVGLLWGGLWYNGQLRHERDRAELERDRAETNFRMAFQAVDNLLREVGAKDLENEPHMEQQRRRLLEKALRYYQEFLKQKSDDPIVRKQTGKAHKQLGDVFRLLQQTAEAEKAYQKAIAHLDRLAAEFPEEAEYQNALAESYNWLGELYRESDRLNEAAAVYREALKIQEKLAADYPKEPEYPRNKARSLFNLGIVFQDKGQAPEAEKAFAGAIAILKDPKIQFPDEPPHRQELARALINLGLFLTSRSVDQALAANSEALALLKPLAEKLSSPEFRKELAIIYNNRALILIHAGRQAGNQDAPAGAASAVGLGYSPLGTGLYCVPHALLTGRAQRKWAFFKQAEEENRKAWVIAKKLVNDFSSVPGYQKELANTYNLRGVVHYTIDLAQTADDWEKAVGLWRNLAQTYPRVADYQAKLAEAMRNLGLLLDREKKYGEARLKFEEALEHLQKALKAKPNKPDFLNSLFLLRQSLAESLVEMNDHKAAVRTARELARTLPHSGRGYFLAACFIARCVGKVGADATLSEAKRVALKKQYGDLALDMLKRALDRKHPVDFTDKNLKAIRDREDFKGLAGPSEGPG